VKTKRLFARANVRLAFTFAAVFLVSTALVFGLTFFSVYETLRQEDLETLRSRLLSFWAQYQYGGISVVRDEIIQVQNLVVRERPYAARIATQDNQTVLWSYPDAWDSFNFVASLESRPLEPEPERIRLESPEHSYALEVGSIELGEELVLQIGLDTQSRERLLAVLQQRTIVVAVVLVLASFGVGVFAANRALKPIRNLNEAVRTVRETGRLDARIGVSAPPNRRSELDELAVQFDGMLDRIQDLVAGMRGVIDSVAHDMRTPLTRLRGVAELALQQSDRGESARAALETTVEESERIHRMLETMLDISEAEAGVLRLERDQIDASSVLGSLLEMYDYPASERGIELRADVRPGVSLSADRVRFQQVVANLLDNALKYAPEHSSVELSVDMFDAQYACVRVRDRGPGIAPGDLERIWERMFRSGDRAGHGLGLSLVRAIVEAHGGSVAAGNHPDGGAEFRILWPLAGCT
jgi:signal transduction histidine kinase